MTTPPYFGEAESTAYKEAIQAALEPLSVRLAHAARRVLDRLTPERWPLAWHLPLWLGQSYGLAAAPIETLTLSNLCGLGFVRLQDDLADGAVAAEEVWEAACLSGLLYGQAVRHYATLFEPASDFWRYLERYLSQWLQATSTSNDADQRDAAWPADDFLALAGRGAPLKASATACALLAGRPETIATLERALNHAVIAMVLQDHVVDCLDDLASGRFNVLLAYAGGLEQQPANREANAQNLLEMMWLGDRGEGYWAAMREHLLVAAAAAQEVDCPPLVAQMERFLGQCDALRAWFEEASSQSLRSVTAKIFADR